MLDDEAKDSELSDSDDEELEDGNGGENEGATSAGCPRMIGGGVKRETPTSSLLGVVIGEYVDGDSQILAANTGTRCKFWSTGARRVVTRYCEGL